MGIEPLLDEIVIGSQRFSTASASSSSPIADQYAAKTVVESRACTSEFRVAKRHNDAKAFSAMSTASMPT